MSSLLFVEAFGRLLAREDQRGIVTEEEDLYSVFTSRADLMGWSSTSATGRPLLWGMNDAELTAGNDRHRIGWVQVGPRAGDIKPTKPTKPTPLPVRGYRYAPFGFSRHAEPAVVLPALVQCFDDSLRRFGVVDLSGLQVTAGYLESRTGCYVGGYSPGRNYYNTILRGEVHALIAFDHEMLGGLKEAELLAGLQRQRTSSFEFGPVVAVPEQYAIKAGLEMPIRSISPAHSGLGISVTLPEWTAGDAAWALAVVIDTARDMAPDTRNFTVRMTRTG